MIRVENILIEDMIPLLQSIASEGYTRVNFVMDKKKRTVVVEPVIEEKKVEEFKGLTKEMLLKLI